MRQPRQMAPPLMLLAAVARWWHLRLGPACSRPVGAGADPEPRCRLDRQRGHRLLQLPCTASGRWIREVQNKIINSPTFFLAVPLPGRTLLGLDYSSNSLVDGGDFNEYELFARRTPMSPAARATQSSSL